MTEHKNLTEALCAVQAAGDAEAEGKLIALLARQEDLPTARRGAPPFERFWTKVGFGLSDCWYWVGCIDKLGYGRLAPTLGEVKAHRFAYRLFHDEIPPGMVVMHRCDVRNCVNPEHLMLGTQADNVRDMMAKGRWRSGDNRGEKNGQARLTRERVAEARALVASGVLQRTVAERFGVSPMCISRAVRGESWK